MCRTLASVLLLASCVGCAMKPKPPASLPPAQVSAQPVQAGAQAAQAGAEPAQPKPPLSLAQRLFGSFPHPGDGSTRRMPVDDDKRDKDTDF